jgi:hypothetical protein
MPIQYGEFTIIHNEEEEGFFNSIFRNWFNTEIQAHQTSQIVILFEDGEICEIKDKFKDFKYIFLDSSRAPTPSYFERNTTDENEYKKIYFKKDTKNIDGIERLNGTAIFQNYSKYAKGNAMASVYNSIYYHNKNSNKPEVLGFIRIKSSESKPRFQFAYDNDEFSKEEVIYLINYLFKNKIET